MRNYDEWMTFTINELNTPIDIFREIPFQIFLIPYGESGEGALWMKFDHILSDGLGAVSLICSLASNSTDLSVYPKILHHPHYLTNVEVVKGIAFFPFYLIVNLVKLFSPNYSNTPFIQRKALKNKSKFIFSKDYPLGVFSGIRQKYSITFNDCILAVVSMAIKKLVKDTDNNNDVKVWIAYGMKALPLKPSDVDMRIDSWAFVTYLPWIDNWGQVKELSNKLKRTLKNKSLIYNWKSLVGIICSLFTYKTIDIFWEGFNRKTDIGLSNIPGPCKRLVFGKDMECTTIIPVCTSARGWPYLPLMSYNGMFRFYLTIDDCIKVDPNDFIKSIELIIEDIRSGNEEEEG